MKNYGRESVNGACLPCQPPAQATTIPRSPWGLRCKIDFTSSYVFGFTCREIGETKRQRNIYIHQKLDINSSQPEWFRRNRIVYSHMSLFNNEAAVWFEKWVFNRLNTVVNFSRFHGSLPELLGTGYGSMWSSMQTWSPILHILSDIDGAAVFRTNWSQICRRHFQIHSLRILNQISLNFFLIVW